MCWVVIMYHIMPFESRAIPLNMLKNSGLMACASGRLPEICLRGRKAHMPVPLEKISACGDSLRAILGITLRKP